MLETMTFCLHLPPFYTLESVINVNSFAEMVKMVEVIRRLEGEA